MELPPSLRQFFGIQETNGSALSRPRVSIPPPQSPPGPSHASSDWIWVPMEDMHATGIVLAILRQAAGPVEPATVTEKVLQHQPDVNPRSVLNIGPRQEGKLIERTNEGWVLRGDKDRAPVLHKGHAWGPPTVFDKQELAAHRRIMLAHLLDAMPGGLQVVQIVEQLKNLPYCRAPVSKDLVKADLSAMQEVGKVKRVGNTRKWVLSN